MVAQQTHATVATDIRADQAEIIAEAIALKERPSEFTKLVIPSRLKVPFPRQLQGLNITARSLFSGVDGLGRSIWRLAEAGASYLVAGRH